jgi:hypothetical protein
VLPTAAAAQSVCSSDGQLKPVQLMERFTNADCADCWRDPATAKAPKGAAVLDWVLPGAMGDDAPLSAVASRDGVSRLESLGEPMPRATSVRASTVAADPGLKNSTFRVARGLALSGYIGASIQLKPAPARAKAAQATAWLALVETLPTGLEGSPVERNLVRNVFQSGWNLRKKPSKSDQNHWFDQRSMGVAEGVNPDRLAVIGWLADEQGRILAAAQSRCTETP